MKKIFEFNQKLPFRFLKIFMHDWFWHTIAAIELLFLKVDHFDWAESEVPLDSDKNGI
jgi:hypothetical protein